MLIQWSEKLAVGIAEIDNQHQRLIALINELSEIEHDQQKEMQAVEKALDELVSYTLYHFGTEERLMEDYVYADEETHLRGHEQFLETITQMVENFSENEAVTAQQIINYLSVWLNQHILRTDKALAAYLLKRGVN